MGANLAPHLREEEEGEDDETAPQETQDGGDCRDVPEDVDLVGGEGVVGGEEGHGRGKGCCMRGGLGCV